MRSVDSVVVRRGRRREGDEACDLAERRGVTAVATGTVRVSSRSVLVLPGTVTDEMAPPPKIPPVPTTAVCGEPAWFVTETLKVADEEPLFTILNAFVFEKSLFSSSKPKFMLIENRSPFALAITCVAVDFAGCTSPVPPRLMRFASICDGSPVFTIAALMSSAVQDGCACRVSAATPATCGEAIEVPEIVAAPFPVPTPSRRPRHRGRDVRLQAAVTGAGTAERSSRSP